MIKWILTIPGKLIVGIVSVLVTYGYRMNFEEIREFISTSGNVMDGWVYVISAVFWIAIILIHI